MKIGLIDSGLDIKFIRRTKIRLLKYAQASVLQEAGTNLLELTEYSRQDIRRELSRPGLWTVFGDGTGHGTKMAGCLLRFCGAASFIMCRVFDDSVQTHDEGFVAALEWMIGQTPRLINLSLGSFDVRKRDVFYTLAAKACRRGVTLCCAGYENPSYPALLDNVITVVNENTYARFTRLDEAVRRSIDVVVKNSLLGEEIGTTSEACALFSGLLARYGRKRLPAGHLIELTDRARSLPAI